MQAIPAMPTGRMVGIDDRSTLGETFFRAAQAHAERSLIAVPANPARGYLARGVEITYAQAAATVRVSMRRYAEAGYGVGHRIGLLLENRPEHLLHKLALNALGVCCVPLNAEHRPGELAYVIEHARLDAVLLLGDLQARFGEALARCAHRPATVALDEAESRLPRAAIPAASTTPAADTPACILYTSGTTGRPKGCVLTHRYELAAGAWYASRGAMASFRIGAERIYNPLPLNHVNASILSFVCALLTGNCQVQTDRFSTARWWTEVRESRATVVHYLGVVVPMLLGQAPDARDREHAVRFGLGAGVEPQLHAAFEARFGFPLIEIWGMTEIVRLLIDHEPPRQVGTRAFGRAQPGLEVRVADDADADVPDGTPGEMLLRHSAQTPRRDFFSGYLDDEAATEAAWRGGWFHTGDIVVRDAGGMLHFVDRRKNIIRRSGENIAAAEVEALLQSHPAVAQVAVLAVPDELREEEVLACVVLRDVPDVDRGVVVQLLFDFCYANLAYYKAPGWIWLTDRIPTTATQKIQKHQLFEPGIDPRKLPGMVDLRARKKRGRPQA